MHHTLLPETYHNELRRDYRRRAIFILCITTLIAVIIGLISLFPAYINSLLFGYDQSERVESLDAGISNTGFTKMNLMEIKNSAILAITASTSISDIDHANVADVITSLRGKVSIDSLLMTNQNNGVSVVVRGIAPKRSDLIDFSARLESDKRFEAVDLPVSDLAKSNNVPFSIKAWIKNI